MSLQRLPNAMLVYWLPWSEWWITESGLRVCSAMFNAATTRSAVICSPMDQPTTLRLKASTTTARYKKPVHVGM